LPFECIVNKLCVLVHGSQSTAHKAVYGVPRWRIVLLLGYNTETLTLAHTG